MKKYDFDGKQYVKLDDLKYEIRKLRNNIELRHSELDDWQKTSMRLAYNDIVRSIFKEEYNSTEDPDEKEAIIEMEGSFILTKPCSIDGKPCYFAGFVDGEPKASCESSDCLVFSYEGTAQNVAESLEENWEILDVSEAAHNEIKELLAFFTDTLDDDSTENLHQEAIENSNEDEGET